MKLLLMSDSHLLGGLQTVVNREKADINLHMGDSQLQIDNPELSSFDYAVRGNCDFAKLPELEMFELEAKTWLLIHGDQVSHSNDLESIAKHAETFKCDVICYGHTHVPIYSQVRGITILNPGSFARSRSTYPNSYMTVEITGDKWQVLLKDAKSGKLIKEFEKDE